MTNYVIKTGINDNGIYVYNDDTGAIVGGPYKNEESAKRRIRELRRKDAENVARADGDIETGKAINAIKIAASPITSNSVTVGATVANDPQARDEREAEAEINSDMLIPNLREIATVLVDAMKLAASSAYGRAAAHAPSFLAPTGDKISKRARTAGVYPAVGKNEYRRRWNYA